MLTSDQESKIERWVQELRPDREGSAEHWNFIRDVVSDGGKVDVEEPDDAVASGVRSSVALAFANSQPPLLPPLEVTRAKYGDLDLLDYIRAGSFGWVFAAERPDRAAFAIKIQPIDRAADYEAFANEEWIVWKFRPEVIEHSALLQIHGSGKFEAEGRRYGWYAMPLLVDATDLCTFVHAQDRGPDEVAALVAPVVEALRLLHSHGFVHGDIAPKNILVSGGRPRLTDYGLSRKAGSGRLGTETYYPKEDLAKFEYSADLKALCRVLRSAFQLDRDVAPMGSKARRVNLGPYRHLRKILKASSEIGSFEHTIDEVQQALIS